MIKKNQITLLVSNKTYSGRKSIERQLFLAYEFIGELRARTIHSRKSWYWKHMMAVYFRYHNVVERRYLKRWTRFALSLGDIRYYLLRTHRAKLEQLFDQGRYDEVDQLLRKTLPRWVYFSKSYYYLSRTILLMNVGYLSYSITAAMIYSDNLPNLEEEKRLKLEAIIEQSLDKSPEEIIEELELLGKKTPDEKFHKMIDAIKSELQSNSAT